jgi:hypothetical protein
VGALDSDELSGDVWLTVTVFLELAMPMEGRRRAGIRGEARRCR